jgi:UPF0288 family protein (methanogenesis marker protein 3)
VEFLKCDLFFPDKKKFVKSGSVLEEVVEGVHLIRLRAQGSELRVKNLELRVLIVSVK